jgi:hypothetical protein
VVVRRTFAPSKRRAPVRGRLTLRLSQSPVVEFRHGLFRGVDNVRLDVGNLRRTSCSWRCLVLTTYDEQWYWFEGSDRLAALHSALEDERSTALRARVMGTEDQSKARLSPEGSDERAYWATGNYDPERYYRETRGWSPEYRDYVRDAYGDLDTYESNHPD